MLLFQNEEDFYNFVGAICKETKCHIIEGDSENE